MFVKICQMVALLLSAATVPGAAQDRSMGKWGQAGGWRISVDRSNGDGCFAIQHYEDGTNLRIGVNPKNGGFHFFMSNRAWQSLEAGKTYPVKLVFEDRKNYEGDLKAVAVLDTVVLMNPDVGFEFAADFMARTSLRIYYRGSAIASLSLRDTHAALSQVMACQKEMWAATKPGDAGMRSDPFSRPSGW